MTEDKKQELIRKITDQNIKEFEVSVNKLTQALLETKKSVSDEEFLGFVIGAILTKANDYSMSNTLKILEELDQI